MLTPKGRTLMLKLKICCCLFCLILLFSSCRDGLTGMQVKSEAEVLLPLAHGSFTLGELLNKLSNDSLFADNEEGVLTLSYLNDPMFSVPFGAFFTQKAAHDLVSTTEILGPIGLDAKPFQHYINLQELIIRLSFIPEISTIPEGKTDHFKGIRTDSILAPFLLWPVTSFDACSQALVESGKLQVILRNEFPVAMQARLVFIDSSMNFMGELALGFNGEQGILPAASDSGMIDLAGKSITSPLYFYIKESKFFESETSITLNFADGFNLDVYPRNIKLKNGYFHPAQFEYRTAVKHIALSLIDSLKLQKVGIRSGKLHLELTKAFDAAISAQLTFPGIMQNNKPLSIAIPLEKNNSHAITIELEGMEMDLSPSAHEFNLLEYTIGFSNQQSEAVYMQATDQFAYSIKLENLEPDYIEGDFGQKTYHFKKQTAPLHKELWDMLGKQAIDPSASLSLHFNNPLGFASISEIHILATNHEGNQAKLSTGSFTLPFPEFPGTGAVNSSIELNASNSKLLDFLMLPPVDSLNVEMFITSNPNGKQVTNKPNFLNFNDSLMVGFQLAFPLRVRDTTFYYRDTLLLGALSIPETAAQVKLICRSRNELPMNADLELIPFDTLQNKATGTPLHMNLLEANTHINGSNNENIQYLILQPDDLQALSLANTLLVKVSFSKNIEDQTQLYLNQTMGFEMKLFLNITSHALH